MKKRRTHQCIKNKGLGCLKIFLFISFLLASYAKQGNAECTLTIAPMRITVPPSGGIFSLRVLSPTGCNWTSSENVDWISITSGSTGVGNGTVMYAVSSNTGSSARSAVITIFTTGASSTHVVTQGDSACRAFITGSITESVSGEKIKGAIIETNLNISVSSLPDGSYLMIHPAGTFNMIASKQGFCSETHREVRIPECDIKTEDFELQPKFYDIHLKYYIFSELRY